MFVILLGTDNMFNLGHLDLSVYSTSFRPVISSKLVNNEIVCFQITEQLQKHVCYMEECKIKKIGPPNKKHEFHHSFLRPRVRDDKKLVT